VILTVALRPRSTRPRRAEGLVLLAGAVLATQVVFGQVFGPTTAHHPLEYVIFPFVIAAALRGGPPVTSIVVLGASAVTIWNTVRGAGPFAGAELHESLILLQAFMGVLAGTGLLLAAAIAERETGERRRAAAYAVGEILATAPDLASASPGILRGICENLEWDVGALWLVESDERHLRCLAVWTGRGLDVGPFESATRGTTFRSGVGLPGRVWASGGPAWIENVAQDGNFPRASAAREVGVRGAFGFPIRLGEEVVGVIECFRRSEEPPDPDLLRTMSAVGSQVGQFVGRKRQESATETANRAKDEFLATLSHELRTPLNAIVGWTRMLLDGTMDPGKSLHALKIIDRNAQLQAQLVADILDVSRIIIGKLRLDLRPIDVGPVVAAAVDAIRPAAHAKQVRLRSRFDAVSRVVRGDPQRLQQVIWNLLANAVKFTEAGGTVAVTLRDGGRRGLQIRVDDDGAGIDPEFLPHVFERFRQADGSVSRLHGGLGLGLAIVRHLTELHGGSVRAESAGPGRGAAFTVELPVIPATALPVEARDADAAGQEASEPQPLSGYRLLVVDDQADARELMIAMLTAAGAEVESAASVAEALHKLDTMSPHALLADIGMPGSDGYSLIREVRRRDPAAGRRLPAAAITAYAGDHDRDRAVAAGFDCHVPKPVSRAAIVTAVRTICRTRDRTA
jgi:signal transduction histidine kinase/CheY-like chemotaxis protein